jgi:plastocyanin domain-containing protein
MKNAILAIFVIGLAALAFAPRFLEATRVEAQTSPPTRTVEIVVQGGYRPAHIDVREGERIRLRFVRRESDPCTEHVVFPSLGIERRLPPNEPVVIEFPAQPRSTIGFECGMKMIRGTLSVRPEVL